MPTPSVSITNNAAHRVHPHEPARLALAQLPTPLVRVERIASELGVAPFWIKRDDLTGLEFSGNKIRKLEYILAAMQREGQDALVTEGTSQSNHCRAVAAACARLGFRARLLFRPLPSAPPQGNHMLDVLFGAQIRMYSREELASRRKIIVEQNLAELREAGCKPRWTPAGASEPLGCWGYIRAMGELSQQLDEQGIRNCDVVMGASSDGTLAGALLGAMLVGADRIRVWGVPVSDDADHHRREINRLCDEAKHQFALDATVSADDLRLIDGYVGSGYAIPTGASLAALRALARCEGMLLDPVYTAKAFLGFIESVRQRRFGADRAAIFLHTGGLFSNFAWSELLTGSRE